MVPMTPDCQIQAESEQSRANPNGEYQKSFFILIKIDVNKSPNSSISQAGGLPVTSPDESLPLQIPEL